MSKRIIIIGRWSDGTPIKKRDIHHIDDRPRPSRKPILENVLERLRSKRLNQPLRSE